MKVLIIYDSIDSHPIRIVKYGEEVRYFGQQNFGEVPHKLRGFDKLEELYEWATDEKEYCRRMRADEYNTKYAFYNEREFNCWINSLCDDMDSLEEIYLDY